MGETFIKLAAENFSQRSSERDDEFDRFVDRVEGPILIRGQEISASNALYSDIVAYRASLLGADTDLHRCRRLNSADSAG